jgi:hypothetical protein
MSIRSKYALEKTPFGLQYVIPGTEMPKASLPKELPSAEGDQYVLTGAESISVREFLLKQQSKPMKPRVPQKPVRGTELFR